MTSWKASFEVTVSYTRRFQEFHTWKIHKPSQTPFGAHWNNETLIGSYTRPTSHSQRFSRVKGAVALELLPEPAQAGRARGGHWHDSAWPGGGPGTPSWDNKSMIIPYHRIRMYAMIMVCTPFTINIPQFCVRINLPYMDRMGQRINEH